MVRRRPGEVNAGAGLSHMAVRDGRRGHAAASATSTGAPPHHTPDGFRNLLGETPSPGWRALVRWRWRAWRQRLPPDRHTFSPRVVRPEPARLERPTPTVTWIGHATLLVRIGGLTVLTDPHFSERASPLRWLGPRRVVPPALALEELPRVDLALISHNHYDHLDLASVRHLARRHGTHFLVPLGLARWFRRRGIDAVTELDWWQRRTHGDVTADLVPAQHWSARTRLDRNRTLWGGWLLEHRGWRIYFAGDTGYSGIFTEIGRRYAPIDLAAIPIGAYAPRWFMHRQHVDPEEAVRIHRDLGARQSLAIHWGTFGLTDEPLAEPPQRLAAARAAAGLPPEAFLVVPHGTTVEVGTTVAPDTGIDPARAPP